MKPLYVLLLSNILLAACNHFTSEQTQTDTPTNDTSTSSTPAPVAVEKADATQKKLDSLSLQNQAQFQVPDSTLALGKKVYNQYCLVCHQANGSGVPKMYPPLANSDWVQGDKKRIIEVVLNGLSGEIQVNGQSYNQVMPSHSFLKDNEIAATLTYVRLNFGNQANPVSIEEVSKVRK